MRTRVILIAVLFSTMFSACSSNSPKTPVTDVAIAVHHESTPHPDHLSKHIEYFWARPSGPGPWPVLIFIHGHQGPERPGGRDVVDWGVLQRVAGKGVVAVSISQPGYGQSDGPPDYCGPFTQNAVLAVLKIVRGWDFVRPDKIGLYGVSRGAVVASMVEARDTKIAAAILVVGSYDLKTEYEKLKKLAGKDEEMAGIEENFRTEAGVNDESFSDRSAVDHVKDIKTPTLILNGAKDPRVNPTEIVKFGKLIEANGIPVKVVIFPEFGHSISIDARNKEIAPFLEKYLGVKY